MPVLEPEPTDGRKKLLQLMGLILGVVVLVSVIATIAQAMG
ncbi:SGM_5486 family transporter-associated protein [Streptomyces tateyamensis]|nr:SGM_5486 family transporter-associated protein [Streptomyces tateyamensis]